MTRTLMLAAALAMAGTPALACGDEAEATRHYNRALMAYFAVSATLAPEAHGTWTTALRTYQTALGRGDYPAACRALDEASVAIGI